MGYRSEVYIAVPKKAEKEKETEEEDVIGSFDENGDLI